MSSNGPGEISEDLECPVCRDALTLTERGFTPCECGFRMCGFCFKTIREDSNKCPQCRRTYDPSKFVQITITQEEIQADARRRARQKRGEDAQNKRDLSNIRVVQRDLVYVTNLSLDIAKEDLLMKNDYFGQYGKIIKMVVNRSNVYQGPSVSCYVTYSKPEEAMGCIDAVDGCVLNDRTLRASFGTTKYCSHFLKNRTCSNSDCMYLHKLGDDKDSFTKEDMQAGKHLSRVPQSNQTHQSPRYNSLPPPKQGSASNSKSLSQSSSNNTQPLRQSSTGAQQNQPNAAWKSQSVGPSVSSMDHRKTDMGYSNRKFQAASTTTNTNHNSRQTQTMLEQYDDDDEYEEKDEEYDEDEEESIPATNKVIGLQNEEEFPALPSLSNPQHRNLKQSNSNQYHQQNQSQHPPTSTSSHQSTPHNRESSDHYNNNRSHRDNNNNHHHHHKSHWHAKDNKPVWAPKAVQQSSASSHSKSDNPHSNNYHHGRSEPVYKPKAVQPNSMPPVSQTNSVSSINSATTVTTTPVPIASYGVTTSSTFTTPTSTQQVDLNSNHNSTSGPKSPWKPTPTQNVVSIQTETQRLEQAKAKQLAESKQSALPPTASWATNSKNINTISTSQPSPLSSSDLSQSTKKAQSSGESHLLSSRNQQSLQQPQNLGFNTPEIPHPHKLKDSSPSPGPIVASSDIAHLSSLSGNDEYEDSDNDDTTLVPNYLLSAFAGFGPITPSSSSVAIPSTNSAIPTTSLTTQRSGLAELRDSDPVVPSTALSTNSSHNQTNQARPIGTRVSSSGNNGNNLSSIQNSSLSYNNSNNSNPSDYFGTSNLWLGTNIFASSNSFDAAAAQSSNVMNNSSASGNRNAPIGSQPVRHQSGQIGMNSSNNLTLSGSNQSSQQQQPPQQPQHTMSKLSPSHNQSPMQHMSQNQNRNFGSAPIPSNWYPATQSNYQQHMAPPHSNVNQPRPIQPPSDGWYPSMPPGLAAPPGLSQPPGLSSSTGMGNSTLNSSTPNAGLSSSSSTNSLPSDWGVQHGQSILSQLGNPSMSNSNPQGSHNQSQMQPINNPPAMNQPRNMYPPQMQMNSWGMPPPSYVGFDPMYSGPPSNSGYPPTSIPMPRHSPYQNMNPTQ